VIEILSYIEKEDSRYSINILRDQFDVKKFNKLIAKFNLFKYQIIDKVENS